MRPSLRARAWSAWVFRTRISEWLPLKAFSPRPARGRCAVQCRKIDNDVIGLLKEIDHPALHAATDAERTFLGLLWCGCRAPSPPWPKRKPR